MPAIPDREAEELRRGFERVAEGRTLGVAWRATHDHFAGLIASTAETISHADRLVDAVADDLKSTIRRNWRDEGRA
jgi:hypothetical protein